MADLNGFACSTRGLITSDLSKLFRKTHLGLP
jgi:hypothetical protein